MLSGALSHSYDVFVAFFVSKKMFIYLEKRGVKSKEEHLLCSEMLQQLQSLTTGFLLIPVFAF